MLSTDDRSQLLRYHWPGNVRELQHLLERACIMGEGAQLTLRLPGEAEPETTTGIAGLKAHAHAGERAAILAALDAQGRNVTAAAAALGVSRKTLWQKMKRYGISRRTP